MKKRCTLFKVFALVVTIALGQSVWGQQQSSGASEGVSIKSMVLTTEVVERAPVDSVQTFTASDSEAFCHIRVQNSGEPTTVTFRWLHNGEEYFTFDAKVGVSSNWRTYSSVTPRPGEWQVQILAPNGDLLTERTFMVEQEQSG